MLAAQFFDFDLGSAREDGLHLVLGADHFGCIRAVAAQVDGVKLALGRTHAAAFVADPAGTAAGAGADHILAVVLIQPVRQVLQIDRLLLRRDRLFDRDGTLAELTFHADWMRYDCYVDLGGAVLGYLTEPMPVPELDGFTPAAFRGCCA